MIGSALSFLASRPATTNVLLAEVYAGGPEALRIRARGVRELASVLNEGSRHNSAVPKITSEVVASGIVALARRQFLRNGAESLTSLAPIATYIALAPYLGVEEACAAANGDGRTSPSPPSEDPSRLPYVQTKQTKWALVLMLGKR